MKRRFPVTDEQKAEIEQYLRDEAIKLIVTQDDINRRREKNKHRDRLGYRIASSAGGRKKIRIPNPHGSYPYCRLCDKRFEIGESVYSLIGGNYISWFHVKCAHRMAWTWKRAMTRTDRSRRKKRR